MLISDFSIAKRENNSKRDFIVINKLQGKHYPGSPLRTAEEFREHGRALKRFITENCGEEVFCGDGADCVVIGFAETAVAIGAFAARELGERCFYVSTSREPLPDCFEKLFFEESHSHAVHHTLCIRDRRVFEKAKCVVIADDEFTTGNTACKLAEKLRQMISPDCRIIASAFIASKRSRDTFSDNGILCCAPFGMDDLCLEFNGKQLPDRDFSPKKPQSEISLNSVFDFRLGVDCGEYFEECESLCGELCRRLVDLNGAKVSVIGTEELCVPPIILGEMLERRGCFAAVQGVTRSPMLPLSNNEYPIKDRAKLKSFYDSSREVFLYNRCSGCNTTIIMTDADAPQEDAVCALCGALDGRVITVFWRGKRMRTSLKGEDCTLLLKNITGQISPLSAKEREPLIQSGVHYSELLPAEYIPSSEYIRQFELGLSEWSKKTADAVSAVAEKIYSRGKSVIVSLARAGTPVGALIVRYLRKKYGDGFVHYSISIIRGKGIDKNALKYILARHSPEKIQFVDGWTGKGAITRQLAEALVCYPEIDPRPAVLADPAGVCGIKGTAEDIFIPCACLNSTVSGLFSRTVLRDDLIEPYDFHGAAYFPEFSDIDRTYEFIEAVENNMTYDKAAYIEELHNAGRGLAETERIAENFGVSDINLVKPGIGETTRVLLRRIPRLVLVRRLGDPLTAHIEELAAEKGTEVREYPLECYHACGIIRLLEDV